MNARRQSACVIGAGMSGLAAIRALTRGEHEVVCYEAGSALGGMWRYENDSGLSAAYASLHTNTSRRRMQYPSLPMDRSAPEFPHHTDMLAYLEAYADHNELRSHIVCGSPVESAQPVDGAWEVSAAGRAPRRFDVVVVAAGHYAHPSYPEIPGEFAGTITHSRDYRTPEPFVGKRVAVVGGAQSAIDIVAEISTVAERTILACSGPHHLLPRRVLGRPFDSFDTPLALATPLSLVRFSMRAMMALSRATPEREHLPAPGHPLFETRWPAVASPAAMAALAAHAFEGRPRITELCGDQVRFADGSAEALDAVVFATGYRIEFPFLPAHLGRGKGWEFPLYRRILSPHAPGLAFIGALEPGPGLFEIVERQCEWLAGVLAGHILVPDQAGMWAAIDSGGEHRSRRQFSATGPHTILCNRHAYLRLLAKDLRETRNRPTPEHSAGARAVGEHALPALRVTRIPVPEPDDGVAADESDYADGYQIAPPDAAARTAEEWMRSILEDAPWPVRWFVLAGWTLVLGFRPGPLRSTAHVIGWPIADSQPEQIVLEHRSWLISANLVLEVSQRDITWMTLVRYQRPVARVVWAIVGPLHRLIVPYVLGRAALRPAVRPSHS